MKEVGKTLKSLQADAGAIHFVPWRGDFTRGIYVSSSVKSTLPVGQVLTLYQEFYAGHPFTVVTAGTIDMKQVINTNKCLVGIEQQEGMVVVHTAIDNLLKGASGQAVQNMNLMFGLEETAGLKLKSIAF